MFASSAAINLAITSSRDEELALVYQAIKREGDGFMDRTPPSRTLLR